MAAVALQVGRSVDDAAVRRRLQRRYGAQLCDCSPELTAEMGPAAQLAAVSSVDVHACPCS